MLMQQNQMLVAMLAQSAGKKPSVTDLLGGGGGDSLDDTKVAGARGCAARIALREQMEARPAAVVAAVRRNLARARSKELGSLSPGDMREFFTRNVPLGKFQCLTYFSFLLAQLWEDGELLRRDLAELTVDEKVQRRVDKLLADLALGCVFAEQVAVEGGMRYRLAWLLTQFEEPPWSITRANAEKPEEPHGKLAEAQWVAAQIAYLRDMDLMSERLARGRKGDGKGKDKEKDRAGE